MNRFAFFSLLLWIACQSESSSVQLTPDAFPKIDVHTHYRSCPEYLAVQLDKWNMQAVLIDVFRADSNGVKRYWDDQLANQEANHNRFYVCSGFNAYGIDEPGFAEQTITRLRTEIKAGARMVKVWKNIGMVDKDRAGNYVQIDDPRFQPIWDFLIEEEIPVLAHIGEPIQAWRPLIESEQNPHFNYYTGHPQYHAYQHPEIPRYETILTARDNWLAQNPELTVIGAHMGSMSHDVQMISERLDRYPNFHVEPAARFGDIVGQDSRQVKAFFEKYQDRILYGTDLGTPVSPGNEEEISSRKNMITRMLALHWTYLSGSDSLYYDSPMISFPLDTKSLNLSTEILRKVYSGNAKRILKLP